MSHPIISAILLIISLVVGGVYARKQAMRRRLSARGGILGNPQNGGGFFQLDTKEVFTGNSPGKVD